LPDCQANIQDAHFRIDENTKIVSHAFDSLFAIELNDCINEELGIHLETGKNAKSNFIEFIKVGSTKSLSAFLKENALGADFNPGDEGYVLVVFPEGIKIISKTDAGIFYGIQTLKQLIQANRSENQIPCLIIYDYPDIAVRGWQDDISRGPIPTMEMLKQQIRKMASFKLNYFTLYIEHVFQFDCHPGIAPNDGISKAQLDELSAYAKQYHVKLIGNYQSFGHMEKTLSLPQYQHMAESKHIISPALDESYQFLADAYQEIVPAFDGGYFNINCDETHGLGEGKSKAMVDSLGVGGVYWGAENSWNAPVVKLSTEASDAERTKIYNPFNRNYDALFYGLQEGSLTDDMLAFSGFHQSGVRDIERNSRFFEPVFPIYFDYVKKGKRDENLDMLEQTIGLKQSIKNIAQKVRYNNVTLRYLLFAIRQVESSLQKNLLRIDVYEFINGTGNLSDAEIKKQIDQLADESKSLQAEYVSLWNLENREWWLEKNIAKFEKLTTSIENLKYHCLITAGDKLTEKGREISIRTLVNDQPIYYTLNEDTLTQSSSKYTGPFFITDDTKIVAGVIHPGKTYPIAETTIIDHKGIGKLYKLNSNYSNYHPSYDGGGNNGLLDGKQGEASDLRNGKWQGFSGQNIDIEIDLGEVQAINFFSMGLYQNTNR